MSKSNNLTGFQLLAKKIVFKTFASSAIGQCREYYSIVGEVFQVTEKTVLTLHCDKVSTWHYDVDQVGESIFFNKKDAAVKLKEINNGK
jgi:hypothetical protein